MRIIAFCQYGWPEPYPSLNPMEEMAKRGHYVKAITGTPNYPMGITYEKYKKGKNTDEEHNGVKIHHVKTFPRGSNPIKRIINYYSYANHAKKYIPKIDNNYDVVYINQTSPIMMAEPGIKYAKRNKKRSVLYCMDLWPASLSAGGLKKNSMLYAHYFNISNKIYNSVDLILITSKMFRKYLMEEFNVPSEKIIYLPQYALSEFNNANNTTSKTTIDFVFAGNIGKAQNLEVVLRVAKRMQGYPEDKKVIFHLVGDGQDLERLKEFSKKQKINNVIFHGRKPAEEMPKYYSLADAMLISLTADPLISYTLPAKMQSYMSAGKPIIASANGEIANVINESKCGYCTKADDDKALYDSIVKFINNPQKKQFGKNAREYYEKNFAKEVLMNKLERILKENCINNEEKG